MAMWQTEHVAGLLQQAGATTEIVTFETKGDKILNTSLSKIGSKGVFTAELEEALYEGSIDIAVHSAKDLPSELPEKLALIAVLEREGSGDVLVSNNPDIKPDQQITIGTSSTRRVALLKHFYPQLKIVDMRGNLQTRFRKMEEGQCDAMVLAYAGVHRMGYDKNIAFKFPIETFVPPAGQGSVAIEAHPERLTAEKVNFIRSACNHEPSEECVYAERSFLATLEGGCSVPVFCHATLSQGSILHMSGGVVSLDGKQHIHKKSKGHISDGTMVGRMLAEKVLAAGGGVILDAIKQG